MARPLPFTTFISKLSFTTIIPPPVLDLTDDNSGFASQLLPPKGSRVAQPPMVKAATPRRPNKREARTDLSPVPLR